MALDYDPVESTTYSGFMDDMVDNIFVSLLLLNRFRANKTYVGKGGGLDIVQSVIYQGVGSNCDWVSSSGQETIATTTEITAARFDWKYLYAALTVPRSEELQNSGKEQIFDLISAKLQIAEMSIKEKLGIGLFSDGVSNSNSIIGLQGMIGNATYGLTTYGGIARSGASWWNSRVDATSTTLGLPMMQSLYGLCTIGSEHPTLILGQQVMFNRFWNRLQAQQRFEDKETVNAGFSAMMFNGTPFVVDPNVPANYLLMLNEKYLYLVFHRNENFRFQPFAKPLDYNRSTAKIYWMGAFLTSNPRMQGVANALTQ